jgi:trimeric autotransporter adhesin
MKKQIVVLLLTFLSWSAGAQTAASYLLTEPSGGYTSIGSSGTALPLLLRDDTTITGIPIGFSFNYCGTAYTTLSMCSNGWITLGTCTSSSYRYRLTGMPCSSTGLLMPFFDDLYGKYAGCSPASNAFYTTSGSAPNRVFIAEWKDFNCYPYAGVTTCGRLNMQVKLYESTNVIEFQYGDTLTVTGMKATIGIANSATDFQTLSNNSAAPSQIFTYIDTTIATAPAAHQIYRFTPCRNVMTPIIGTVTTMCAGNTVTLADTTAGGTWSSLNNAIATVSGSGDSGYVTGVSGGLDTIRYSLTSQCYADTTVLVPRVGAITGTLSLCPGNNSTLADTSVGTWSGGTAGIATISATGVVSGIAVGTATITFTSTATGCTVTAVVTVNALPAAITGVASFCAGTTLTLHDATVGGTWSTSNNTVATVGSATGVVFGVAGGSDTVSYSTTGVGCSVFAPISVNPLPAAITGGSSVCLGSTLTLNDATAGGTWSSHTPAIATITAAGVVGGASVGTDTISYTSAAGCLVRLPIAVVALPGAITGTFSGCAGTTTTLGDASAGGTWTSGSTTVATVGASNGVVSFIAPTVSIITYTVASGCFVTQQITVNPNPAAITGTATVCAGHVVSIADATAGGTWSSSAVTTATVASGGPGVGIVGGVAAGSANISYSLATGCYATVPVTVGTQPAAITGTLTVCNGATTSLADATVGGTWSSVTPAVATVSAGGVAGGASVGTSIISYAIGTCVSTAVLTVNTQPAAITGTLAICNGATSSLSDVTPGGTWSSVTPAVATISAIGLTGGASVGTSLISYAIGSCAATATVTVSALPAAGSITGLSTVCVGNNITLADASGGGTWSTVFPALATVGGATGIVTGLSAGIDTIKYTVVNGCGTAIARMPITVNTSATVSPITGPTAVCLGSNITLADVTPGGTWAVSAPAVATVSAGVVSGLAVGTAIVSYSAANSCGTVTATYNITVDTATMPHPVAGPSTLCVANITVMTDSVPGGTWSVTNGNAFINSATGLLTGIAAGVDTVVYSIANACATLTATKPMTILPLPAGAPITGPSSFCTGAPITLADAIAGGVWSATNTHASVGATGIVTGSTSGIDTIVYTLSNACGFVYDSAVITVNAAPAAGSITGPGVVCVGTSITLADPAAGGTFTAFNSNATVGAISGIVTGVAAGIDTVLYTVVNSCGTASTAKIITVNPIPSTGVISGAGSVCVGATTPFTNSIAGGTWSVTNGNANINAATGLLLGVAAGTDTVFYNIITVCGSIIDTAFITINPLPSSDTLAGPTVLCVGSSISLVPEISGGSWSASNSNATVSGGVITGAVVGTDIISYTVVTTCGTGTATKTVTINSYPTAGFITGGSTVCTGAAITLTESVSGGTWSTSNGDATIGASSGTVTGIIGGVDTITYTVANSCGSVGALHVVTVNTATFAGTISGPSTVCVGSNITVSDAVAGGTWSIDNAVATLTTIAGGAVITGVAAGVDSVRYTLPSGCGASTAVLGISVQTMPTVSTVSGAGSVCVGASIGFVDASAGGTWSVSNANATIVPVTGVLTGVSAGTDNVIYTVANSCGSVSASSTVTINPLPSAGVIAGTGIVCLGASGTYADGIGGGVWSSGSPAIASVNPATGVVSGITAGTAVLSYTTISPLGCSGSATLIVTVQAAPAIPVITGTMHECAGVATVLNDAMSGGSWASSNTAIATINASGVVTGVAGGIVTISYTVTDVCGVATVTTSDTVYSLPAAGTISGAASGCIGFANTLVSTGSAGSWSVSDAAIANITPATGVITGISSGVVTVTYTVVNSYGCSRFATASYTVNAAPVVAAIAGTNKQCVESVQLFSDATIGGTWSSANTSIATVNSASGFVTGMSAGVTNITYTVVGAGGCSGYAVLSDTVITVPALAPITGALNACPGSVTTLSDATAGGTWSSLNTSVASVNAVTGIVTGIMSGTAGIIYTVNNICGNTSDTVLVTVHPIPTVAPISGPGGTICAGEAAMLTDATTGGTWSTGTPSIATVNSTTGLVAGLSAGTAVITYTINVAGCTNATIYSVTIGGSIGTSTLIPNGTATICHGNPVNAHVGSTASGLNYQWNINGNAISGATASAYSIDSPGYYSVTVGNGSCLETVSGLVVSAQPNPVISFTSPNILSAGSFAHYQWYFNGSEIPGATSSVYFESASGYYTVVATDINGCSDTSAVYTLSLFGAGVANLPDAAGIRVYPTPVVSLLHVDAPIAIKVKVLTVDGKVILQQNGGKDIDMSRLSNGVYMVMVYNDSDVLLKIEKVVKVD